MSGLRILIVLGFNSRTLFHISCRRYIVCSSFLLIWMLHNILFIIYLLLIHLLKLPIFLFLRLFFCFKSSFKLCLFSLYFFIFLSFSLFFFLFQLFLLSLFLNYLLLKIITKLLSNFILLCLLICSVKSNYQPTSIIIRSHYSLSISSHWRRSNLILLFLWWNKILVIFKVWHRRSMGYILELRLVR